MASAKTAASRGTPAKENGVKLQEGLNVFKSDKFDSQGYVQSRCSLNEKEIRQLCSYLLDLKRASAEEMHRSVYANYSAFIRTSKEISDLEGELSSIRNLLSTQAALIHGLAEGVKIDSLSKSVPEGSSENGLLISEYRDPTDLEKWLVEFPDLLDVLRVDEALDALDEGERVAAEAKQLKTLDQALLVSLQTSIVERRQKLADQLAEAACQPSTRGGELRAAISALKRLGMALGHTVCCSMHISKDISIICKAFVHRALHMEELILLHSHSWCSLLLLKLLVILRRYLARTNIILSELVMWAIKQTEAFASLIKRHALASYSSCWGLRAAASCVNSIRPLFLVGSSWFGTFSCAFETL
ncbi:hypothetical protein DVH24_000662 [Malus domestica]|uniref:Exocyst component Exo84 C-terminal domain-containing protein n=1 Tax=Malus domestica TaxID=3750 RepID=A0A498J5J2_MALDO|nr:hypothetical protein DVH24_000662 [Malus domestica]